MRQSRGFTVNVFGYTLEELEENVQPYEETFEFCRALETRVQPDVIVWLRSRDRFVTEMDTRRNQKRRTRMECLRQSVRFILFSSSQTLNEDGAVSTEKGKTHNEPRVRATSIQPWQTTQAAHTV